ncbi:MAG: polysaccharide deacetylase family protein [Aerococcaceae bacterium]|nr:polysaccharide deacetylase family protein [Aerococcaceae bacterium]
MSVIKSMKERFRQVGDNRLLMQLFIYILAIFMVASLIFMYFFGGTREEAMRAEQAVAALYSDEREVFLNAELSQSQLEAAKQEASELRHLSKFKLIARVESAQKKWQILQKLNTIYHTETPMISGDAVSDNALLSANATNEHIQELLKQFNDKDSDAFYQAAQQLTEQAAKTHEVLTRAKESMQQLPQALGEEVDLLAVAEQLKAAEVDVLQVENQPAFKEEAQQFARLADEVAQHVLETQAHEGGTLEDAVIQQLFACQALAERLTGTPVDGRPLVALTFDDGPNTTITPQILAILAKHDVKATFFVMGAYVDDHPDIAKQIVDQGHQIANHTYTHPDLAQEDDAKVLREINFTQESIKEATGVEPTIYRLPFGSGGERVVKLLKPLTSIIWNVDSQDWQSQNADIIVERVMSTMQHQSILLMHDTHQASADALDRLIPLLKEQGYQFVMPQDIDFPYHYY